MLSHKLHSPYHPTTGRWNLMSNEELLDEKKRYFLLGPVLFYCVSTLLVIFGLLLVHMTIKQQLPSPFLWMVGMLGGWLLFMFSARQFQRYQLLTPSAYYHPDFLTLVAHHKECQDWLSNRSHQRHLHLFDMYVCQSLLKHGAHASPTRPSLIFL